ncbi:hypothetical protein Scep_010645 [Stephania cephalantha]|uniref:Uncharacterized protein n=1 Tax=Stephania cephalantha TaxID=152367 RepID=A0AAP0PFF9_9MAGN
MASSVNDAERRRGGLGAVRQKRRRRSEARSGIEERRAWREVMGESEEVIARVREVAAAGVRGRGRGSCGPCGEGEGERREGCEERFTSKSMWESEEDLVL